MRPSDKHHSPHARSPSFSQKPSPFFTHHSQHASLPHTSYSTHFPYSLPHFLSLHTLPLSHSFHLCCSSYLRKHDPYTLRIINHNASNDIKPFPFLHISVFTLLRIYRIKPHETSTPHHSINNSITPASCLANLPKHFRSPTLKRDYFIKRDKKIQPKILIIHSKKHLDKLICLISPPL